MPLPDVLARLEAMVVAATVSSSEAAAAEAAAAGEEARVCIICEEAPREVRFACGHAIVCKGCLSVVRLQGLPIGRGGTVPQVPDVRRRLRRAAGGGARRARAPGANVCAAEVIYAHDDASS